LRNSTNSEIGEADHWHGVKGKSRENKPKETRES